jgi:hypothetical protein
MQRSALDGMSLVVYYSSLKNMIDKCAGFRFSPSSKLGTHHHTI